MENNKYGQNNNEKFFFFDCSKEMGRTNENSKKVKLKPMRSK